MGAAAWGYLSSTIRQLVRLGFRVWGRSPGDFLVKRFLLFFFVVAPVVQLLSCSSFLLKSYTQTFNPQPEALNPTASGWQAAAAEARVAVAAAAAAA